VRSSRRIWPAAFSLVEVIIALGIFLTGVIAVIALISASAGRSRESMDSIIAYGMAERIRSEIISHYGAALPNPSAGSPLRLVAARSGDDVRVEASDGREAYYVIEVIAPSAGELARDPARGTVGVEVTVRWPYRSPGAMAANPSPRNSAHYPLLILR